MRFAHILVRHRVLVLGLLLPVTLALGWAGAFMRFDFTPQAIYAGDGNLVEHAEDFRAVFGHDDAVLLLLLEATGPADTLATDALSWVREISEAAADFPHVARITSLATVELPESPQALLTGLGLDPLLPPGPLDPAVRERLEAVFAQQPLLRESFVSKQRRLQAVHIHLAPDARDADAMRETTDALAARLANAPPPTGYTPRTAGLPALRTEVVADLESEQVKRLPVTALAIFLVLLIAYRRLTVALLPLIAVTVGLIWTAGVLVLTGHELNIISNILPVLLLTIGTANAVHVMNRYAEEAALPATGRVRAAVRTIQRMAPACLLTYLTTAIGFLSLLGARSTVLREVGVETALGLALLYVATIVVLGALLVVVRPPAHPAVADAPGHSIARLTAHAGTAVARHPVPILVVSILLMVGAAWGATGLCLNCRLLETYDDDHPASYALALVERNLGGVLSLDVDLESDTDGVFVRPDVVRKINEVEETLRGEEAVLRVRSTPDLYDAVLRTLPLPPASAEADDARLALAHAACTRLAPLVGLRRYLSADERRAGIEIRVRDVGSAQLLVLSHATEKAVQAAFPSGGEVRTSLTGDAYVYAAAMDHFIRDMLVSLLGAAVVIFAVIALLFRSVRLGLISTIPNLTPLALTLGYMRLRGYELNASGAIVFAISLGVAVDNTIHFLARYREERRQGDGVTPAIHRTLYGAGRAMVLTSLVIVLGLAALHLSDFLPTRRFAELTSVTMVAALLGDLLVLPACLTLFDRPRRA